jgi:hypothetical protein
MLQIWLQLQLYILLQLQITRKNLIEMDSRSARVARQLHLHRGILPKYYPGFIVIKLFTAVTYEYS